MESRIARKVAALSGIAGTEGACDDAGRGRSWFSDYRRLTIVELGLGGPVRAGRDAEDDPGDSGLFRRRGSRYEFADGEADGGWAPIPSVTLRSYGPDTKAALVLTGANHVLAPVARAVRTGLEEVRRQIDDECLLVVVTQTLLQEVFEAQPVLFLHGIQAGLIQRALGLSSIVGDHRAGRDERVPLARLEFGWDVNEPGRAEPERLGIVHDTWNDLVVTDAGVRGTGCRLSFRAGTDFEQDHAFSPAGRTDRRAAWVATLSDLSEHHLAGRRPGEATSVEISQVDGEARATAIVPRERQIELILARLATRLVPHGGPVPGTDDAAETLRTVGLPRLDVARWSRADVLDRRAVLLAHFYAVRGAGWLAGMRALNRRRDRSEAARRFADLAAAAEQLLEVGDALRLQLVVHCRAYVLQYRACRGEIEDIDHATYREIIRILDRLVNAAAAGRYSPAALLEQLHVALVGLGTFRYAAGFYSAGAVPDDRDDDLRRLWATARETLDGLTADGTRRCELDHDYAGYLVSTPSLHDVLEGIRLLTEDVIPARRDAAKEGWRRGLRVSLQIRLRAMSRALDERLGTYADRAGWIAQIHEDAEDLANDDAVTSAPRTEQVPDNAVVILLFRIAAARVSAATAPGRSVQMPERELTTAAVERVVRYAGLADAGHESDVDDLRVKQIERLAERWSAWITSGAARTAGRPVRDVPGG